MTPSDLNPTQITPADWLPGYELIAPIGSGGFGTVFQARQLKLDRIVAVKVLRPGGNNRDAVAARFDAEAVMLAKLSHPNVVQVFDCGHTDDRLYLAMELLEGEDLGRRLLRSRTLDERLVWSIARQAALALAHATRHNIVHRDIKPTNLYLVPPNPDCSLPEGVPLVKVMDFGLAKWTTQPLEDHLTTSGVMLGTPVYMAPEQFRQPGQVDHRADMYALGATVFHALSGRAPFTGKTPWDVMAQKLEHKPRLASNISRESAALVAAMMDPDPAKRLGCYDDLIPRIDQLLAATSLEPRRPTKRARWVASVAALGILVGTGIGAWGARSLHGETAKTESPTHTLADVEFISEGSELLLYDCRTLSGWTPLGGGLQPALDEDRLKVLAWHGTIRRTFEPHEAYRLRLGIDVNEAESVEVQFGIPVERGPIPALQVSRKDGVALGVRHEDGRFDVRSEAIKFPSRPKDRPPYREVRIERSPGQWHVWFNSKDLGRIEDDVRRLPEVRLVTDSEAPARMDSALLAVLRPK